MTIIINRVSSKLRQKNSSNRAVWAWGGRLDWPVRLTCDRWWSRWWNRWRRGEAGWGEPVHQSWSGQRLPWSMKFLRSSTLQRRKTPCSRTWQGPVPELSFACSGSRLWGQVWGWKLGRRRRIAKCRGSLTQGSSSSLHRTSHRGLGHWNTPKGYIEKLIRRFDEPLYCRSLLL